MLNYRKISKNIQIATINNSKTLDEKLEWVNIVNARKKEIEYLRKNYNFELRHLHASLGKAQAQRPIVEQAGPYLFIILHFPVFENNKIIPSEIEFFLGHGYLITIHNGNNPVLKHFFNLCKKDDKSLLTYEYESSAVLLYEILDRLMQDCFALLDKNSIAIAESEKIIFSNKPRQAVAQILLLRRNIANFRKIMQNHKNILKKLAAMHSSLVPEELIRRYYNELIDHSKRIWEILENQKEMIEIFYDTNESLLNNQLNEIMKTLTIFSVIVFPLTLLAGIFGMNTIDSMPLVNHPAGFWIILGMMLISSLIMLIFFKRRHWL